MTHGPCYPRLCVLLLPLAAAAQQDPVNQGTVFRVTVNLVQVDAVVTDSKGRHVSNLKPDDFEILEDGRSQKITHFEYVDLREPRAAPPPQGEAVKGTGRPVTAIRLRPEQVRRTIALLADDLGLSRESVYFVRRALHKFVDEQMLPGDLAAVIRTSSGTGVMQQFTNDKQVLHAAIDKVRLYRASNIGVFDPLEGDPREKLEAIAPPGGGRGRVQRWREPREFYDFQREYFTVGSLGALRFVVDGMRTGEITNVITSEPPGRAFCVQPVVVIW